MKSSQKPALLPLSAPAAGSTEATSTESADNAGAHDIDVATFSHDRTINEVYMANFRNIIASGNEPDMLKEYKPRIPYQMDRLLNPQQLKRHVLHSEKMRSIIAHYASQNNCSARSVEREVREILDEIGLERNLAIIRWCGMAITAIGKRITSGIYVNSDSIDTVRQGLGKTPVLYLPSHRSYMDFILMSYICYYYDIEIPGIAAGMDFHSMFGMGTMLRKTGAFFMRRSFSNDELYWDVFREYMYALVSVYHIGVEFFIEGTRSRNFKALVPKIGLLSMALLPYFTGDVPDVTIVPVSVSYERVLEEMLFVYELLGVPKPRETTRGFFKALKIVDERFGKMYLDFGAPISVREFFGHTSEHRIGRASVGAHLQRLNRQEVELIKKLANEIIYQQQQRIVISTFNLLSLFYASQLYAQRSVSLDELATGVRRLKSMFEQLGAHVATNLNSIKPEIIETVEIHSNIVHFHNAQLRFTQVAPEQLSQTIDPKRLKAHQLMPQTMAVAVPALALQLYVNPCLFWLARPAYLVLSGLQVRQEIQTHVLNVTYANHNDLLRLLSERVASLENLFKNEFIIESNREQEDFERNLKFLEANNIMRVPGNGGELIVNANECSRLLLSTLVPFLCLYYQLAVTLNQFAIDKEFKTTDVLIRVQERIEQLLQQRNEQHVHPYCLALDNLNIALNSFIQEGYLERSKESGLLRHNDKQSLKQLEMQLLNYCQLLPFTKYHETAASLALLSTPQQTSKL